MTQEEKDLLLKVLCAMLPYRVKCNIDDRGVNIIGTLSSYEPLTDGRLLFGICDKKYDAPDKYWQPNANYSVEKIKPYLRPMSSMTEDEMKTYRTLQDTDCSYHYDLGDIVEDFSYSDNYVSLDYLNSIHIDYRGLIPMGLALEALEDMYNTKTE